MRHDAEHRMSMSILALVVGLVLLVVITVAGTVTSSLGDFDLRPAEASTTTPVELAP